MHTKIKGQKEPQNVTICYLRVRIQAGFCLSFALLPKFYSKYTDFYFKNDLYLSYVLGAHAYHSECVKIKGQLLGVIFYVLIWLGPRTKLKTVRIVGKYLQVIMLAPNILFFNPK